MVRRAVVKGVGQYLPERIVPNAEFEKTLDTTDEWIKARGDKGQMLYDDANALLDKYSK